MSGAGCAGAAATMGAMTTTLPPSIPPRLVEHEESAASSGPRWQPPPQLVRGALAGAEAAIGSWLVIAVVAIAGYVATAASPQLGSAGWLDAAAVGSTIWLLGHGGALQLDAASITVIPLGVTVIGLVGVASSVRRARLHTWWPAIAAALVYTAFAGGFAMLAGTPGSWRGVLGAPVVAAIGLAVGMRGRYPRELGDLIARLPAGVRAGVGAGARAVVLLLGVALMTVLLALVLGLARVREIHESLVPDGVSTVIIAVAQIVLLPTFVVWGASVLAGPGFAVGAGTLFSPTGIDAGPLPVVPVLGALPEPGSAAASAGWVVMIGVLVGAAAGWWLLRRRLPLAQTAIAVGTASLLGALAMGVLAWASSGSVGPGRMAQVGPDAASLALAVGWQLLLGAALVALALHPEARELVRRGRATAGRWWGENQS